MTAQSFLDLLVANGVTLAAITFDSDREHNAVLELRGEDFAFLVSNEDIRRRGL